MQAGLLVSIAAGAFALGSFPTAYVLVRASHGSDLRKEGSGNIGALNAYEVSRSRKTGISVLLIDLLKGAIPVLAVKLLLGNDFVAGAVAMIAVVLGHNFSPWIGFKGGRGLSPAAGASLVFNPVFVLLWVALWLLTRLWSRDVHVGNIFATAMVPVVLFLAPGLCSQLSAFPPPYPMTTAVAGCALLAPIFVKHLGPLRALLARDADRSSSDSQG
jgi:glycerol-3-phosphate acyltransferase PlsY